MNLANNLKKIRKDNNLSQEELADKLGVTRQSVSKWESGAAYPEMDKVLQICKLFNVNIDDLFNKDLGEVKEVKESKKIFNKYVDDIINYITNVINIFSNMSFKDKIKCILEQIFIIVILVSFFFIFASIGSYIVSSIFGLLPGWLYRLIYGILEGIYVIVGVAASILLIIHTFKVRYIDYYEAVLDESDKKVTVEEKKEAKEKIIIRDPKHTGYNVVSGIAKIMLFIVKIFIGTLFIFLCFSLIFLLATLVMSFLFIKTGLLFLGGLLIIIGFIIINIIFLILLFNFLINKKNKFVILFTIFIVSLLSIGIGMGLFIVSTKDITIINNKEDYITEKAYLDMEDDLYISSYDVNYIVQDRSDIKIEMTHSKYNDISIRRDGLNELYFTSSYNDIKSLITNVIDDINNKQIYEYDMREIDVYANEKTISKLKDNYIKHKIRY